jgi:hypothetical protein
MINSLSATVATIETAYITEAEVETLLAGKAYITEAEVETLLVTGDSIFIGEIHGTSGTFSGTVTASAIVAAESFTAATAEFNGISASGVVTSTLWAFTGAEVGNLEINGSLHIGGNAVDFGAANSGGSGYRIVRVPN